jgi:hypothetical protein
MTEHGTFRSFQRHELHTSQFNAVLINNKPKMKAGDCNYGIRVIPVTKAKNIISSLQKRDWRVCSEFIYRFYT